jgi:superfamily II DNA or RNA helicase
MDPWPHQQRAVNETLAALKRGQRRLCLTSPTGGGKTLMVQMIAQSIIEAGGNVALYSNRRMMIDQLSDGLVKAGLDHGIRAAGQDDERERRFQVCSLQTERSRTLKRKTWKLHAGNPGDIAILDEGHLHTGPTALEIRKQHIDGGAATLDVTATPLGMDGVCDHLIHAGTMTEMRACGALVPAHHFGVDEPDLKAFRQLRGKLKEGEDLSENMQREVMMTPSIMGRVWSWYNQLNPEQKPAILFGPGVNSSLWFAQQFHAKGVSAAHLDGKDCWINGKFYRSDKEARDAVRDGSKSGEIKVVTNRFVLREGVDWPWVEHLIMAFIAGSVQTYIQIGGRGLRASPSTGKTHCTIQDHGGMWHQHGSLNVDREWRLEYTPEMVYGLRAERMRTKKEREPRRCPQCSRIINSRTCPCGYEIPLGKQSRPVVSTDGTVRELTGDIFVPRRISNRPDGPALWEKMFHRSKTAKGARTFRAAAALFAYENNWGWPSPDWPLMPVQPLDWFRKVGDVPVERLRQKENGHG